MNTESISSKQGLSILIMYTLGSSIVMSPWKGAGNDGWISVSIAMIMMLPMVIMYSRILVIFPGKDLFDLQQEVFGKIMGKITSLFFVWFAFHIGALIIREFAEFIIVVNLPETPLSFIVIIMGIFCIWIVKGGIEVVGRYATFVMPLLIIAIVMVSLLLIPKMDFNNIRPVLYNGISPVLNSATTVFAFPFAEIVLFIIVFNSLKTKTKIFKMHILNIIIAGCIMIFYNIRENMILGNKLVSYLYFPSYSVTRLVNIKNFIDRIEVTVGAAMLIGIFIKASICLYVASIGFAKTFKIENYRQIVAPIGLLMIIVSIFVYKNTMEMFEWATEDFKYYIIPFSIVLPLITLIAAEFKLRIGKHKNKI